MLTTTRRLIRTLLLLIAIGAALSIVAATRAAAPQMIVALNCPRGQVVWLEGDGPPFSAALVVFNQRTVGGGSVPASGRWRIPLRAEEARGVYAVSVVDRATRAELARYQCYVDVPLPGAPAEAPAEAPAAAAAPPTAIPPTATAIPLTATPARATATRTAAPIRATSTRTATMQPTATSTPVAATASATATSAPTAVDPATLITPTKTPIAGVANSLRFYEALGGDPATINTDMPVYGYVTIKNSGSTSIDLTGWKLVNLSAATRPVFTFPSYTLAPGVAVVIVPDSGTSTDEMLFWGINQIAWESGHRLVLRTPQDEDAIYVTFP